MNRWFWYVSKSNEIFVDLDSPLAISRALSVVRRSLQVKKSAKSPLNRLDIESVWLYPTQTEGHAHLIIVLKKPLPFLSRVSWSLWLGTDQIRAAYVMERFRRLVFLERGYIPESWIGYVEEAELLSVREPYGFRKPDTFCFCSKKHKAKNVTDKCDALERILGDMRSDDYFPRNRDKKERDSVRFGWGKLTLSEIRAWRPKKKHGTSERQVSHSGR